jgi:hypothetical protein
VRPRPVKCPTSPFFSLAGRSAAHKRCHQFALTLRAVGGLSVAEIARALLTSEQTVTRRITRAKQSIKDSGVPFALPSEDAGRLDSVLLALYLIFNEGYASTVGTQLLRVDLTDEAIRLARILHAILPDDSEVSGLLAPDAPCPRPAPSSHWHGRIAHPDGKAGPRPVGSGGHPGGSRADHGRPPARADRAVPASGRDRRGPRRSR